MKMRKGFTLVELLIVIVIIGILAAAMLLSTTSATASAKASTIITDLRSMKAALLLLYADSMDNMPTVDNALQALKPYIDNPQKYLDTNSGFKIEAGEGGAVGKWIMSFNVGDKMKGSDLGDVKKKLAEKAEKVGLFADKKAKDVYKDGNIVYMIGR